MFGWWRIHCQAHSGYWHNLFPCNYMTQGPSFLQAGGCLQPPEVTHTGDPQSLAISSRTLPHGILHYGCSLQQASKESFYFQFIQHRVLHKVPNHKWHSITFAIFYWLDASHSSHPHSRGGDYIKAWTPRIVIMEDHHRVRLPQWWIKTNNIFRMEIK